jgi:hypothetical protein
MSQAQCRLAVLNYHAPAIDIFDRSTRLAEAIKAETRWLLLTAPARSFALDEQHHTKDRAAFVDAWPYMRRGRMPADNARGFYELVSEQASILANLIEVRQQQASQCGERRDADDERI